MKTKFLKREENGQVYWVNTETGEWKRAFSAIEKLTFYKKKLEALQQKVASLEAEIDQAEFNKFIKTSEGQELLAKVKEELKGAG